MARCTAAVLQANPDVAAQLLQCAIGAVGDRLTEPFRDGREGGLLAAAMGLGGDVSVLAAAQ
jgi:hypothetical protein